MKVERPWVRGELGWLTSAPLYRVHESARQNLDEYLERFPYRRIDIDGRVMTSDSAAHAELARGFAFPDYYGENWDAFRDCFRDFVEEHAGELVAVVWEHIEVCARTAPATAIEVGWALLENAEGWAIPSGKGPSIALDVFVVGEGDDFDRP